MAKYFKASLLIVFSVVFLVACGDKEKSSSENKKEQKELVVVDWGGAGQEAAKKTIYGAFEKEFGVKVTAVSPPDSGKLKTMVENGNVEWDVVSEEAGIALRLAKEGLFENLDFDVITNKDKIDPEMVTDYTIGHQIYNLNIAYNTEIFGEEHPKSWSEFWDIEKYPGPRALATEVFGLMETALLADGVKPDELYPLDIDRAFASLDKIKDDVKVWWEAGAQPPQLLSSKDAVVSSAWNGRISAAKDEGAKVENEFNHAGVSYTSWAVPKGSPNKDLAMEFINFALEAEQQAEYSKIIDYSPTNQDALELLPDEVLERLGQTRGDKIDQFLINAEYWSEHFEEVNERFNKWLLE